MTEIVPEFRSKILNAAKSLFIQHGYHGLSMREIAESLGVSKPALYYHFKDKENLFLAVLETTLNEIEVALDQIVETNVSAREQISSFTHFVLSKPTNDRAIIRLASQEMGQLSETARKAFNKEYQQKFIGKINAILEAGMRKGEFKQMDPPSATWMLLGIMYPYFYPSHNGYNSVSEDVIQQILDVYLFGLSPR